MATQRTMGFSCRRGDGVAAVWCMALVWMVALGGCFFDKAGLRSQSEDPDAGPPPDATPSACGDGVVDVGEACDDGNQNNSDGCNSGCQVEAGWVCDGEPSVCLFLCGNGTLDAGEQCDGAELGGATCNSIPGGFSGGTLTCSGLCQYDTTSCILPGCGNEIVGAGEECDDGNTSNEDGCLNNCQLATCGDGHVWLGSEECDDGNALNNDACVTNCVAAACGDTFVWAGQEQCDDGNVANDDACVAGCVVAICGDGYLWTGSEQCDDGNTVDGDGCESDCTEPVCGDGTVQGTEECDDGNVSNNDGCLNDCTMATCGDGFIWTGSEECDDNNGGGGDGCSAGCAVEPYFGCDGEPSVCSCVVYVDQQSSSSSANGSSWASALTSFGAGLGEAGSRASTPGAHCAVWVAAATYTTNSAYMLPHRVVVYGGFAGGETALSQRDIAGNVTVIDGNGNADTVVTCSSSNPPQDSGLDGLTVRNGDASGGYGGGVWMKGQNLTLANCIFENNSASADGGGVYVTNSGGAATTVTISRCRVVGNTANGNGAGLTVRYNSSVVVLDSLFHDNDVNGEGGAVWVGGSSADLTMVNCTVVSNTSNNGGGAFRVDDGTLDVVNSILWDNDTSPYETNNATHSVTYTNIEGGYGGAGNDSANPMFANPGANNYQLQGNSPCVDSANGNQASLLDLLGNARFNAPVPNNGIGTPDFVDRGAYEFQGP